MDFFGIGLLEILAVLLLMAVIFGPHRLPEVAAQFGRSIRMLREAARGFRDEYLTDFEEVRGEYLNVRGDIKSADSAIRQDLEQADQDVRTAVKEAEADASTAVQAAESAAVARPIPTPTANSGQLGRSRTGSGASSRGPTPARSGARPANVISLNRRRPKRP